MNTFNKLKTWYLIILIGIMGALFYSLERRVNDLEDKLYLAEGTVSLQMYESIEHWSDSFNIPKHIAYNVAYLETRYKGPFDFDYNPQQTSSAGAKGPMQIIPRYAKAFGGKRATAKRLLQDIDLNVMVSMKMLSKWHSIYHDWGKATGAYNTGQPIINSYAQYATSNKDYKSKWEDVK